MKEIQEILREWHVSEDSHERIAMATLVNVEGSTYRRAGARMMILPDGRRIGALSGGCLESDVAERARQVIATGKPCLVQYNSQVGFDVVVEMGCRGALSILVERVSEPDCALALQFLNDCVRQRCTGVIATVFQVEGSPGIRPGERSLYSQNEFRTAQENATLHAAIEADVRECAAINRSCTKSYTFPHGVADVFLEFIRPPISLVIYGAGDDAIPLAKFAALLGWNTTVLDNRPAYPTVERFPGADRLIAVRTDLSLQSLQLDERSAIVIMSHNYEQDQNFLKRLVCTNVPYIGILGPVKRTERLLNDLRETGVSLSEEFLTRLHSPAGLDIGSETPEEIALSIIAEIQTQFTRSSGVPLRERAASNFDRPRA